MEEGVVQRGQTRKADTELQDEKALAMSTRRSTGRVNPRRSRDLNCLQAGLAQSLRAGGYESSSCQHSDIRPRRPEAAKRELREAYF